MQDNLASLQPMPLAPASRRAALMNWAGWLCSGTAITVVMAWMAFWGQQIGELPAIFFPLLFPLLFGLALGAILAALAGRLQIVSRPGRIAAALVWGLLAVAVQEAAAYRYYLRQFRDLASETPLAALATQNDTMQPASWHEFYIARFHAAPVLWVVVTLLTAGAMALMVGGRMPNASQSNSRQTPEAS